MEVRNNLAALRQKRGIAAAALAGMAGVSRQTIYAMEAGTYVPNTAVALRLARALEASVEELFTLPDEPQPQLRSEQPELLPESEAVNPGQPVQLCRVGRRLIATPPSPVSWYLPASDAIVSDKSGAGGRTRVDVYNSGDDFSGRLLVAGCDPGMSVLARHVQPAHVELVLAHRNSSQALALLKRGMVHVAGTHLRDEKSGQSNVPQISRMFAKESIAVITFALWEEGILTAPANPKAIHDIADLARPDVTMVNREKGAGSRLLLDSRLKQLGIDARAVRGYDAIAGGHLPAAWRVQTGAADCCIATRAAARLFGLGFIPLVTERYDLAVRRTHLDLPAIQALFDTLGRASFRRELESTGGYDTRAAGQRVL